MDPDEEYWLDELFESEVDVRASFYGSKRPYSKRRNIDDFGNPCCEISMISEPAYLNSENKKEENMTKLYKANVAGIEEYVTLIGRDGPDYVVKVSGTDKIIAVKQIIEVMPNTIGIRFNSAIGGGVASKTYHFLVDDLSKFALGDIIIPAGSNDMATVVEVDSKNTTACKKLTGRRVITEAI
jgi:hypothetical protein